MEKVDENNKIKCDLIENNINNFKNKIEDIKCIIKLHQEKDNNYFKFSVIII